MKTSKELEADIGKLKEAIKPLQELAEALPCPDSVLSHDGKELRHDWLTDLYKRLGTTNGNVKSMSQQLSTQEDKIKELDQHATNISNMFAALQERVEQLEGNFKSHVEKSNWQSIELHKQSARLSSLETKPQPSRREVIKRARAYEAKDKIAQALDIIDDRLKDREYVSGSELRTIQSGLNQALTIAEQSLEGGES